MLLILDDLYDRAVLERELAGALAITHDPAEATILLTGPEPLGERELERSPATELVITGSTGFDHLDRAAIAGHGAIACNIPAYCSRDVADHALACALASLRGIVGLDRSVQLGTWDYQAAGELRRVRGATLGIVGLGRIGRLLAADAGALGMRVIATDPYVEQSAGVELTTLEAVLAESDVVSLHAPLSDETRGLIGAERLALMRPGSTLINTARAGLVEIEDLVHALAQDRPAWAFMDVWDVEPPDPHDQRLDAPTLVLTPHAAWWSHDAESALLAQIADAVREHLAGRPPEGLLP